MKQCIIVYLPVLHQGYLQLFNTYNKADIFICNENLIERIDQEFDYLRKEIRAISPDQAEVVLEAVLKNRNISQIGMNDLALLDHPKQEVILPQEDIFLWLAEHFLSKSAVHFEPTFLRWNRQNSLEKKKITSSLTMPAKTFSANLQKIVAQAKAEADLSSDWWRQVAAVVFSEESNEQAQTTSRSEKISEKIIAVAHNHHVPSPYTPYIDSDPRNAFHKGEHIDLSTAIHAEAALIADCARRGIPLRGVSMYVSTFPCPVCAKQIAASGITTLYYSDGYSMLDGERVLTDAEVSIVAIQ